MNELKNQEETKEEGKISEPKEEEVDETKIEPAGTKEEEIEELRKKLKEEEGENAGLYDRLLRLQADYENFKKRMEKEKVEFMNYSNEALLKELLPILDNLERALIHAKNSQTLNTLIEGVELTSQQFLYCLAKFGAFPFNSLGKKFDPSKHEAVLQEENFEKEANIVLEEIQKGYFYKERLLRPALVKISKLPQDQ